MKAMVLERFGGPLEWRDVPDPKPDSGQVLVRVRANGLCATDLKITEGLVETVPLPFTPGHEVAGEVVELGSEVKNLAVGDHVTVYMSIGCGACDVCRRGLENYCVRAPRTGFELDGGFSEYMPVVARNAVKIDASVPFEEAAIIPDAVATAYHALVRKAEVEVGESVLVVGIGGLGIHSIQIAQLAGANVIATDIVPDKLRAAEEYGARVIDGRDGGLADRVKELTGGLGVDVVIECAAGPHITEIIRESFYSMATGGRLVVLGYTPGHDLLVDSSNFIYSQTSIIGSRASSLQDINSVARLVEQGKVKPVVSERYRLEQANEAILNLRENPPLGRIVLLS